MAGVNKVILVGRVGRDPESRTMQNGSKVVNFSMATSETWTDKASGERKEKTQWHRIVIWNEGIAGIAERFVKKGSQIYIEGALESRKFTDKDGAEREITEIVLSRFRGELALLDSKPSGDDARHGAAESDRHAAPDRSRDKPPAGRQPRQEMADDDIPF